MALNLEYLSRIRPLEEEENTVPQLGKLSNSGNVEDFNDANSSLSRNTANLLGSMRAEREAKIKEGQTPLSEKLFRVEMARREARDKAKSYMEDQKIKNQQDLIQLKRIELENQRSKDMADAETERMKNQRTAEKEILDAEEKFKQSENDYVVKNIQNPEDPEEEAFLRNNFARLNGRSTSAPVQAVQTPQEQTAQTIPEQTEPLNQEPKKPLTVNQKFKFRKDIKGDGGDGGPDYKSGNTALNMANQFQNSETFKKFEQGMDFSNKVKMLDEEIKKGKFANLSAVDTTLGYIFNKIQDPTSVVREGEFARAFMGMPLWGKIKGKIEQISNGGMGLDDETRSELIKMVPLLFESSKKALKSKYENILKPRIDAYNNQGYKIDEKMVLGNLVDLLKDEDPNNNQSKGQPSQQNDKGFGITREQAIAELKRRGRI